MKNKFIIFGFILLGAIVSSSSVFSQIAGDVVKSTVKSKNDNSTSSKVKPVSVEKISEADFTNSTHCEPLLRAAVNDEDLARKVFLNSTNSNLEEYKKQHLHTCFNLLDKKALNSKSFIKELVRKYPILYGDIQEPLHSNKEVITAAAEGMAEYKYCILPILESPQFIKDIKLKESLLKINPFCKKYILSQKRNKQEDEENNVAAASYFSEFLAFHSWNYLDPYSDDGEGGGKDESVKQVSIPNGDYLSVLETVKKNDEDDNWFGKKYSNSYTYGRVLQADLVNIDVFPITSFSEKNIENILLQVENIPVAKEGEAPADPITSFTVNTVYKFYHENPNNLIFKNLKERLWSQKLLNKIIDHAYYGYVDKIVEYIEPEYINKPQVLEIFIQNCNPIIKKRGTLARTKFWEKVDVHILKDKINEIFPCIINYSKFFELHSFANTSDFALRMLSNLKANYGKITNDTFKDFYNGLSNELKNNKEIVSSFFFESDLNMYSYLSETLKADPKIKLLAFKYSPDCYALVQSNPDDKKLIKDIFFPEDIDHDLEFLFGLKSVVGKENKLADKNSLDAEREIKRSLKVTKYPAGCFEFASDKLKADKNFILPLLKKNPEIAEFILPPAVSDPEVVKIIAKSLYVQETCSGFNFEKNIPNLSQKDFLEVAKINVYCLNYFPESRIDDEVYQILKNSSIPVSIYSILPTKYRADAKMISNIAPFPTIFKNIPATEQEISEIHEEDAYKAEEVVESKKRYNEALKTYNNNAIKAYSLEILLQIVKDNPVTFTIDYLEKHFPFIYYRYIKEADYFDNYSSHEVIYGGTEFQVFKDQKFWKSLTSKAVKAKTPCKDLKKFYEAHSDLWLPSKDEIHIKLKCVYSSVLDPATKK